MEYEMEEMLPIVAKLADKYTSRESSSVPYETARILMEAVIYCIDECFEYNKDQQLLSGDKLPGEMAYEKGLEYVIEKTHKSKEIYDKLIVNFEDYGCRNYRDTIVKGIPGFFIKYDAKFYPQNHILTLDYPTLFMNFEKQGINLIFDYLTGVELEKRFLDLFERKSVVRLLERVHVDYQTLYLDNICYPVLLNALGCLIADKPVQSLEISQQECNDIYAYFKDDNIEKMEQKLTNMISMMINRMGDGKLQDYLVKTSKDYAVRIWNAMQNHSLECVFQCVS